jgi:uncharacterized protein with HEPN domain
LPSEKPVRRLEDIIDNIDRIQKYTDGYSFERFAEDRKCQDAVERCLSRISEAARKLGHLAETLAPDQPWSDIRSLGNLLRHEYDRIDRKAIWEIVAKDLIALRPIIESALRTLQKDKSRKR